MFIFSKELRVLQPGCQDGSPVLMPYFLFPWLLPFSPPFLAPLDGISIGKVSLDTKNTLSGKTVTKKPTSSLQIDVFSYSWCNLDPGFLIGSGVAPVIPLSHRRRGLEKTWAKLETQPCLIEPTSFCNKIGKRKRDRSVFISDMMYLS